MFCCPMLKEDTDMVKDRILNNIENLSDEEFKKIVTTAPKEELESLIISLREKRAFLWKDRMLLQMIDKGPFTFWACDKSCIIRLWEGASKKVYSNRDMLGKEFMEFISKIERYKAMTDSIEVIETDEERVGVLLKEFENYYTKDIRGNNQAEVELITNSVKLYDEDSGECFYGEIGLPIDLENVIETYKERNEELSNLIKNFENRCEALRKLNTRRRSDIFESLRELDIEQEKKEKIRTRSTEVYNYFENKIKEAMDKAIYLETFITETEIEIDTQYDAIKRTLSENVPLAQEQPVFELERMRSCIREELSDARRLINEKQANIIIKLNRENNLSTTANELKKRRKDELEQQISACLISIYELEEKIETANSLSFLQIHDQFRKIYDEILKKISEYD